MSLNNAEPRENKKSSDHKNEINILLINRGAVTSGGQLWRFSCLYKHAFGCKFFVLQIKLNLF